MEQQLLEHKLAMFEREARSDFIKEHESEKELSDFWYKKQLQFVALDKNTDIIDFNKDFVVICVGINYTQHDEAEGSVMATKDFSVRTVRKHLKQGIFKGNERFHVVFTNLSPVITKEKWSQYTLCQQQRFLNLHIKNGQIQYNHIQKIKELVEACWGKDKIVWVFHTTTLWKREGKKYLDEIVKNLGITNHRYLAQNLAIEYWDAERCQPF